MKTTTLLFSSLLLSTSMFANDIYEVSYSKDTNCTILKNSKPIDMFDKRFGKKAPRNSYTCSAIQKEQYNNCDVLKKENLTAFFMGYGAYEYTNLILAFKNPHPSTKSYLKVKCSKN